MTIKENTPYTHPYIHPQGGALWTRIQRPHVVHGPVPRWQSDRHEEYLAASGMSASALKILATKTPEHFRSWLQESSEPTYAQSFGTLVHDFILLQTPVIESPKLDMRTKDGKAEFAALQAAAQRQRATLVTPEEYKALHGIRTALYDVPHVYEALTGSSFLEISGYAQSTGYSAKIRPDIRVPRTGTIWDLKTCEDASYNAFQRDAWKFGYHIQAAWYLGIANLIEGKGAYKTFKFIAVEKKSPYAVAVYEASEEFLNAGAEAIARALTVFEECVAKEEWPGFPRESQLLKPPMWHRSNGEE